VSAGPVAPAVPTLDQATTFVAEERFDDAAARAHARILLADAVTLALAADTVPGATPLFELGVGSGEHLAWFSGNLLGAADAVQANAAAVCARFQDDTEMSSWSHPGSFVVPAAVAAAVEARADYGALIDGLIAGYAFTVWLGGEGQVALGMMTTGRRPSPNFGSGGACAAASRAAGLDAAQTLHAVSGALLVGRGSLHSVGSGGEDWRLHNPGAARDGLLYALAARAGMTAGPGALDARHGYLRMFAGIEEVPTALQSAPHQRMVLDVWTKALPTLGDNMAVALAARELHSRGVDLDQPVTVHMNEHFANFPGTQTRPPYVSLTAALSSVRFVTAQLLLNGTLTFDDYARRDDPSVAALAGRIDVVPDDSLDYVDAVVTVGEGAEAATCRTSELPRTLFFRDTETQRQSAHDLLGPEGVAVVDAIVSASDDRPAADVVQGAVARFHALRPPTT
jgi:2-methylcitrate dehydratase PrpD